MLALITNPEWHHCKIIYNRLLINIHICFQVEGGENKPEEEAEQASEGAQEEVSSGLDIEATPKKSAKKKKVRSGKCLLWHFLLMIIRNSKLRVDAVLVPNFQ